jgi:outer membrane protein OmpA-like peptidoglycan-associated protein
VVIDKLKLGEKIASDKAVNLPLELALAILTDANGVIDMQVPVAGDVNSPSFELSGVIFKAFINILTKAITAPFTLLAGLVDSKQDLQFIDFASGSVALNDTSSEKLTQLSGALAQRPSLSLIITGRLNIEADRERLQKDALNVQLSEDGVSPEEIKTKGPQWQRAISKRHKRYARSISGSNEPNEPNIEEQYRQLVGAVAVPDEALIGLAEQRAVVVKTYLVNQSGMAANRAVIAKVSLDPKTTDFSGVELGIES